MKTNNIHGLNFFSFFSFISCYGFKLSTR